MDKEKNSNYSINTIESFIPSSTPSNASTKPDSSFAPIAISDATKFTADLTKDLDFYKDWINQTANQRATIFADYDLQPKELPKIWRTLPVLLYFTSIIGSMVWVVSLGAAQNDFNGFCILFSTLKYTVHGAVPEHEVYNISDEDILEFHSIFGGPNPLYKHSNYDSNNSAISSFDTSQFYKRIPLSVLKSKNYTSFKDRKKLKIDGNFFGPTASYYVHNEPNVTSVNSNLTNIASQSNNNISQTDFYPINITDYYSPPVTYQENNLVQIASIDYIYSSWGPICICDYCLYTGVASLFSAFLCCMFFSLCQVGKQQYSMLEHPSRLVLPALVLSFIMCLLTVVSTWIITKGVSLWCNGIDTEGPLRCEETRNYIWVNNQKHIMNAKRTGAFYNFLGIAEASCWVTSLFWMSNTIILMIRFFGAIDFHKASFLYEPVFYGENIANNSNADRISVNSDQDSSNVEDTDQNDKLNSLQALSLPDTKVNERGANHQTNKDKNDAMLKPPSLLICSKNLSVPEISSDTDSNVGLSDEYITHTPSYIYRLDDVGGSTETIPMLRNA